MSRSSPQDGYGYVDLCAGDVKSFGLAFAVSTRDWSHGYSCGARNSRTTMPRRRTEGEH